MPLYAPFPVRHPPLWALRFAVALLACWGVQCGRAADGLPWLQGAATIAPTPRQAVATTTTQRSDNADPSLHLELSGEEPSAIYYDSQTLRTQTPLIVAIKVINGLATARRVSLTWQVTDVNGKVILQKNASYRVEGNGLLLRRELVGVPAYGAYVLQVVAAAKRPGPDASVSATWPFAIVAEPVSGYRPQSFFALNTPPLLSARQLDFYGRIGARVLRSPWQPQTAAAGLDLAPFDQQIRDRLNRKLATVGVLRRLPDNPNGGSLDELWTREVLPLLTRYEAIKTWEIATPVTPSQQAALAAGARAARPDLRLRWPLLLGTGNTAGTRSPATNTPTLDAVTVPWLQAVAPRAAAPSNAFGALATASLVASAQSHPAGTLRALLAQRDVARLAGTRAVFIHQDAGGLAADARGAAGALVRGYTLAIMSGATGMSMNLSAGTDAGTLAPLPPRTARAAAFSALTHLLEDAAFDSDLFPLSPTLWGGLFRTPAAAIATVWTARDSEQGRLVARIGQADLLDLFGNVVARARHGVLVVPLSATPTYIISHEPPETLARALHEARIEGLRPLAAQILPLTQKLKFAPPAPARPAGAHSLASSVTPPAVAALVRVRLQNILIHPLAGVLRAVPPHGWAFARDTLDYQLLPGESHIYQFVIEHAAAPNGSYPLTVVASSGPRRWQWRQALRVATAVNVRRGHPIRLDGDLRDWSDAAWMQAQGATPTQRIKARVALRWNTQRLYIAAEVEEPALCPRRAEDGTYPFWDGYDALQIAFGLHDTPAAQPARGPFYDTEYGFLLCPFNKLANGHIEGRVLRLWSPAVAFNAPHDPLRYGGGVSGAICIVRRDSQTHLTRYEASLPLSAIPSLRPHLRAADGSTVRCGWILHNSAGAALEWSRATSVFPWWSNPSSFLPAPNLYLAALTPLGFTQDGPVDAPITIHPKIPVKRPPLKHPHPVLHPHWQQRHAPSHQTHRNPPQLAPMSPRLLPPVAPPAGEQLPPSLTPSQGR